MNTFLVQIQEKGSPQWSTVARVRARTAAGAILQIAKDARHFPLMVAIRVERIA